MRGNNTSIILKNKMNTLVLQFVIAEEITGNCIAMQKQDIFENKAGKAFFFLLQMVNLQIACILHLSYKDY